MIPGKKKVVVLRYKLIHINEHNHHMEAFSKVFSAVTSGTPACLQQAFFSKDRFQEDSELGMGKKNYIFYFTNLQVKSRFSCSNECRPQTTAVLVDFDDNRIHRYVHITILWMRSIAFTGLTKKSMAQEGQRTLGLTIYTISHEWYVM